MTRTVVYLLLNLVATVGTCQIHYQFELTGHIVYILPFEGPLLSLVGPSHPLVQIKHTIKCSHHSNDAPACYFCNLKKYDTVYVPDSFYLGIFYNTHQHLSD